MVKPFLKIRMEVEAKVLEKTLNWKTPAIAILIALKWSKLSSSYICQCIKWNLFVYCTCREIHFLKGRFLKGTIYILCECCLSLKPHSRNSHVRWMWLKQKSNQTLQNQQLVVFSIFHSINFPSDRLSYSSFFLHIYCFFLIGVGTTSGTEAWLKSAILVSFMPKAVFDVSANFVIDLKSRRAQRIISSSRIFLEFKDWTCFSSCRHFELVRKWRKKGLEWEWEWVL